MLSQYPVHCVYIHYTHTYCTHIIVHYILFKKWRFCFMSVAM